MSNALVLHRASASVITVSPPRLATTARAPAYEPKYVFGDSTPFPHETDVVDAIRQVVGCSVKLMLAHHAGLEALDCVRTADRRKVETRAQLVALGESVRRAVLSENAAALVSAQRTAGKILKLTRAAIEADGAAIEAETIAATRQAHQALEASRKDTVDAVARFAAKNDLPGTRVDMRIVVQGSAYEVEAIVTTPYGMVATFVCEMPETHAWRALRRVRELSEGTTIALPRAVGVFKKRLDVRKMKLDKLLVLGASIESDRGVILLGESEEAGVSVEIDIDATRGAPRVRAREVGEKIGDRDPHELSSDDAARVLRLYRAIATPTRELQTMRAKMTEAAVDGKALRTMEPAALASRIVGAIAPIAREIARRSGAPGELVLRRNVGAGRRDEVYVTAAELLEPIHMLPPIMRAAFAPLGLEGKPRSPRAPVSSMASYEELHDADFIETTSNGDRQTPTLTATH